MELFWELHQNHQIREAHYRGVRGERKADAVSEELAELEARLERLVLLNLALWSLLKETNGLTDDALAARVREIDLLDGRLDGKARPPAENCAECGRALSRKHSRCLYCGREPSAPDPFRAATG